MKTPHHNKNAIESASEKQKDGFFSRVYALVACIPAGSVMTYGQIAEAAGGRCSARYVGFAMASAPAGLPCHRVVNRKGEMAPGMIFGGSEAQRALLAAEGVTFLPNGCIDLSVSRYMP